MSQPLQGLYAITDPQLTPGDRVLSAAEAALRGGATMLQYRDKPADADTRRSVAAREWVSATAGGAVHERTCQHDERRDEQ